jgi:hypothetical protein
MSLEDEAREVLDGDGASVGAAKKRQQGAALSLWRLAPRRGSSQELVILTAEYALLAVQLAALSDACLVRCAPSPSCRRLFSIWFAGLPRFQ